MKKALGLLGVIVLAAVLLMVIPETFQARKSIVINKDKASVSAFITDFNVYNTWNPWFSLDPKMEAKVEGNKYSWTSQSDEVGSGSQTIVYNQNDSIAYDLAFTAPMENTAKSYFLLKEVEGGTEVTWGFQSEGNMFVGLLFDPSGMVGDSYVKGLASLKKELEK